MKLEIARTTFSQFSDDIVVKAGNGSGSIVSEIGQREMREFVRSLLDVADDCMRKLKDKTPEDEVAQVMVRDALDAASAI